MAESAKKLGPDIPFIVTLFSACSYSLQEDAITRNLKNHPTPLMNKQARSRKFTAKQSARLGAYLAAGLGASTAATPVAEAAIVGINIGPSGFNIGGVNANLYYGSSSYVSDFPFSGAGGFLLVNGAPSPYLPPMVGLYGSSGFGFAINGGYASPRNFSLNAAIGSAATFALS